MGGLAGIMLGGYIAYYSTWHWSFAPSLILLMIILRLRRFLPSLAITHKDPIDWVGGLLSFMGLGSILLGLCLAGEFGWWFAKRQVSFAGMVIPPFSISIVPTLIAVGVIFLGFFGLWQRGQARRSAASLMRMGLLRKRIFVFGMLTAMLHTLISTGVQFNLYQFVPAVLLSNPFKTSLAIMPYTVAMIVVLIAVLKLLTLGDRIPPKYIVYTGIVLLGLGLWVLHQSISPTVTALGLMPGLVIMGIGSGLFLSYISALTYSIASLREKPEGSGIYNPVQNLGSSLGRGILGTTLVYFASRRIVDEVLQNLGKTLSPEQQSQAISKLQEMLQTLSQEDIREIFKPILPPSTYSLMRSINLDAASTGMRSSLVIALVLTAICLFLATALPKFPLKPHSED
jgi:MFS family permease